KGSSRDSCSRRVLIKYVFSVSLGQLDRRQFGEEPAEARGSARGGAPNTYLNDAIWQRNRGTRFAAAPAKATASQGGNGYSRWASSAVESIAIIKCPAETV